MAIALNELGELTLWREGARRWRRRHCHHGRRLWRGRADREAGRHRPAHGRAAQPAVQAFGRGLVHVVPKLLSALSGIGTAAMLWVGGGILLHGMEELGAPRHSAQGPRPGASGLRSRRRRCIGADPGMDRQCRSARRSPGRSSAGCIAMIVRQLPQASRRADRRLGRRPCTGCLCLPAAGWGRSPGMASTGPGWN